MSEELTVLSLGWGTQSFALAAMSALGTLPKVDAAIHADTGHERTATYEFARQWTPWLEERGVRVATVRPLASEAPPVRRCAPAAPVFTRTTHGPALEERRGKLGRQCTDHWKRKPVRRWLQANRDGRPVALWMGISLDEVHRMKQSDVRYCRHVYPAVGVGIEAPAGRPWTRADLMRWLIEQGLPVPPRSACYFCPFQHNREWRYLRDQAPEDWQKAVAFDAQIRSLSTAGPLYLHRACRPLPEVDLSTAADHGQADLFAGMCGGNCGV